MELARALAEYVRSLKYSSLDKKTVETVKLRLVDALGCGLGASRSEPAVAAVRTAARLRGTGSSSIVASHARTSPELAAFVNGIMVRYFDYNDTYLSKEPAHPSDNFPPCLAVAEAEGLGGREVILASVAAYEVQCRLCDAADLRHRGWDHVNYGLVSSSLAASKLMSMRAEKMTQAVNIALNGHIAMRQVRAGELSMWKGVSFANAGRNGVFSAMLARDGMTGPSPIFEGEMGFFRQVSGPFKVDTGGFGGRRGRFKVNETYVKYWPAEYHAQTAIWAALGAAKKAGGVDRVTGVEVRTHEAGYTILGKDPEKWSPRTRETADHSLPFIVATALLRGGVDTSSYSGDGLEDKAVGELMEKVTVVEDPALTDLYPGKGMANEVILTLSGGERVSTKVVVPRGHPLNPMTREEVEEKFLRMSKRILGERKARRALEALWSLEDEEDVSRVMGLLRAG